MRDVTLERNPILTLILCVMCDMEDISNIYSHHNLVGIGRERICDKTASNYFVIFHWFAIFVELSFQAHIELKQ